MSYVIPEDQSSPEQDRSMLGLVPRPDERVRCSICQRVLDGDMLFLDETGDVPQPRQSWVFCRDCDAAVREELERSPVAGQLRLRVAVGIVASERSPRAIKRTKAGLHDDGWLHFMFWVFGIAVLLHVFVIAWIAYLIR
jgi:LSD1 subclass zinc finger protein